MSPPAITSGSSWISDMKSMGLGCLRNVQVGQRPSLRAPLPLAVPCLTEALPVVLAQVGGGSVSGALCAKGMVQGRGREGASWVQGMVQVMVQGGRPLC